MESKTLKIFFDDFKQYIVDTGKGIGTASSYRSNVKRASDILNLGEGFLEAIAVITDTRVKASLCEFLCAKLSELIENGNSSVPVKSISDCRSAVSMLAEFVIIEKLDDYVQIEERVSTTNIVEKAAAKEIPFLPAITLPCESVYTQRDMIRIFKQRLVTQDRYYADSCLPVRIIAKINANSTKKDIYKNIILNTKFLYDKDSDKYFRLSQISKLTIKTDGYVKIEVNGKEYDVYTEVYVKGAFAGYERVRVDSFALLSLDHILPVHSELERYLVDHYEFRKLSDSIMAYKVEHSEMTVTELSKSYFETEYKKLSVNEDVLLNEISAFIDTLELAILHRSFNSSKNDNLTNPTATAKINATSQSQEVELVQELKQCLNDAFECAKEEFDVKECNFQSVSAENIVVRANEFDLLSVDNAIRLWAQNNGVNLVIVEEGDTLGTKTAFVSEDNITFSTIMVTEEQQNLLNASNTVLYFKRIDKIQTNETKQYHRLLDFMNSQTVTLGDGVARFMKNILFTIATVSDSIDSYNWQALLTYDGKDGFSSII